LQYNKNPAENIIGQGTLTAIKNGTGGLDAKTISKLCALFDCQPGDIMEYVPEEQRGVRMNNSLENNGTE